MLINIVIFCLFHSTLAIFHHHKALPHTKIHVCLTPPNTMLKVQKHITECQHEVKTNIFNEAFSLINDHAFHHPHDHHATIGVHDHDEYAHPNFTLTEQEILKFFENHDHSHVPHKVVPHAGHLSASSGHSGSTVEVSHDEGPLDEHHGPIGHHHSFDHHHPLDHHEPVYDSHLHHPIANPHPHAWQQPYPIETLYKKTDAVELNKKPEEVQRLMRALTSNRDPYTYFNIKTGEAEKSDRPRRDVHAIDHHHSDLHSSEIHPTTATFKDKRIAGCLMHCLYEKDHAIDPHTGYPTLDGLVNFYSDGVHEHGFFMTTLRAVDFCLKGASHKYHINRHIKPSARVSCDLAFDIFDCVSDHITEYCSKHHFFGSEHLYKGHHFAHFDGHVIDHHGHHDHHDHHDHGHLEDEYHHDDSYYYT